MSTGLQPFASLYFGEAAAEDEAEKNPEMFVKGFYDRRNLVQRLRTGDAFLLIGPKGAGKSSYVEYLGLRWKNDVQNFIKREDLGDLRGALAADSRPVPPDAEINEMAWSTWIWCRLFDSLMGDEGCDLTRQPEVVQLHKQLQAAGILAGNFRTVVREVRKRQHKFLAPKVYEYSTETEGRREIHLPQLRDLLVELVTGAITESTHTLTLDGLDSAFIGSQVYWQHLAALLRAATVIHRRIRKANSTIRIVILCRSDVFLRIQLADSNKIRQTWGAELDWTYGIDSAENSFLWDLLEHKISAGGAHVQDLLRTYFPEFMEVGERTKVLRIPMARYLMDLTRGTPRDIIMLMKKIQDQAGTGTILDVRKIRAGVNMYCRQYFPGEIANELVGMIPDELASTIIGSLSRLSSRRFSRSDFAGIFSGLLSPHDLTVDALLQQLFLAGAIANRTEGIREEYIRFYHRRDYGELNTRGPFLLHTALTLSLNVPFASRRR